MSKLWRMLPWILVAILVVIVVLMAIGVFNAQWLPWVLLLALAARCFLLRRRGLIGAVDLPVDDRFLSSEKVQWWYWTGHLRTDTGKRFGFEIVFFTFDHFLFMRDQLVQAAVTDVDGNSFVFKEFVLFHLPDRTKGGFKLSSGPGDKVTARSGNGGDHLHSEVGEYVLDLALSPIKPTAMHYGANAHPYAFHGYTYYYSQPRMKTVGTISIGGETHSVTGVSWFDRQYGELFQAIAQGWQWFAIQLDDNREIMLFDFNGDCKAVENSGSYSNKLGQTATLAAFQFGVDILGHWTSPRTGTVYPSGWKVSVNINAEGEPLILVVQPLVKDQELCGTYRDPFWVGPVYWEGACSVSDLNGVVIGQAYVELNGYDKKL